MTSGKMVAGITMASELMNYYPRLGEELRPDASTSA
jgi:hypothetical protein